MPKKPLLVVLIALILFSFAGPASALETNNYRFTASSSDIVIPITTLRPGNILVSANYKPSNHGMYVIWILDANDDWLCHSTYDFRWGRTPPLPQTCQALSVPAGNYSVVFRAAMGGKTSVSLDVTAETDQ